VLKSTKRVGDPCSPTANSFSFIRSFFLSAFSPFRLVSHPISGPHPRGFSPLQPDSSISRSSKSYRFYEPPRLRVSIRCACTQRHVEDESMSTSRSPLLVWQRFIRTEKFPSRTKKPTRSRAARLPTSCRTCILKSATIVKRTSRTYLEQIRAHLQDNPSYKILRVRR